MKLKATSCCSPDIANRQYIWFETKILKKLDEPVSEELLTALLKSLYMAGKDEHIFKEETKDLTKSAILGSTN